MRLDSPRITPLSEDNWDEEQIAVFTPQMIGGTVINLFRILANHVKLAKRWFLFSNHIMAKATLPLRDREILILRIGWLCQSEYEWGQHVIIGKNCGLTDAEIANIKTGADVVGWSSHDAMLIKSVDELRADAFISDDTWQGLKETYSDQQMMDLVFTVGQYNMVSMALNSFGVQLDPFIEGF
jgi:4-carboxymuconolactone decarboxylase